MLGSIHLKASSRGPYICLLWFDLRVVQAHLSFGLGPAFWHSCYVQEWSIWVLIVASISLESPLLNDLQVFGPHRDWLLVCKDGAFSVVISDVYYFIGLAQFLPSGVEFCWLPLPGNFGSLLRKEDPGRAIFDDRPRELLCQATLFFGSIFGSVFFSVFGRFFFFGSVSADFLAADTPFP